MKFSFDIVDWENLGKNVQNYGTRHLLTRNENAIIVYIVVSIFYNMRYIVIYAKREEDAF